MIREIKESELDDLLVLYKDLHDSDDPQPNEKRIKEVWTQICGDERIKYFVKEKDKKLVSCCHLVIVPNLTRGTRPYGIIENVVTKSEFRNQGLGKEILKHALNYAWSEGCYKVMLLTGRKDEKVYRFYESVGFDRHSKQAFIIKNSNKADV